MREMRDTNNLWIGCVPAYWVVDRFKHSVRLYTGNSIKDEQKSKYEDPEDAKPYISSKDIDKTYRTVDYDNGMYVKNSDYSFRVASKNDTLMCIEGGSAGKKKAILDRNVCFVNKLCCFHGFKQIESRYLYYYLCSPSYEDEFEYNISGMIGGVPVSKLMDLNILFPPIPEQRCIADFLDAKCAEIDALTADIEKQIETLEQYKRSVITEAVTKGLNPDVEMKDSGTGYLLSVPNHWKVDKLKYHLRRKTIKNHPQEQVLSLYREYGIIPKDSRDDNHNVTSEDTSKYLLVIKGDFVVNKMKAWQGSVAVSDYRGIVSPAYYVYDFLDQEINKRYFHYLMRNKAYTPEYRRLSGGIREGQWDLSEDALNDIKILIPPMEEQESIAEYLDSKCASIELAIEDKKKQLDTLAEYKKSLIYEYVTGKKEVV